MHKIDTIEASSRKRVNLSIKRYRIDEGDDKKGQSELEKFQ